MKQNQQTDRFIREEAVAIKSKESGKSYYVSDFTFTLKPIPKYKKDFKEVEVKFQYKGETITYYCFVNAQFNREDAIEAAKTQIQQLINNGAITYYAKLYRKKIRKLNAHLR